jgi:hypothetical protein
MMTDAWMGREPYKSDHYDINVIHIAVHRLLPVSTHAVTAAESLQNRPLKPCKDQRGLGSEMFGLRTIGRSLQ